MFFEFKESLLLDHVKDRTSEWEPILMFFRMRPLSQNLAQKMDSEVYSSQLVTKWT